MGQAVEAGVPPVACRSTMCIYGSYTGKDRDEMIDRSWLAVRGMVARASVGLVTACSECER